MSAAMAITLCMFLLFGTLLFHRRRPMRREFFSFLFVEARLACLRDRRVLSTDCLHATAIETFSSSNLTQTKYMSLAILVQT
jgi:hypothetical protein